LNVTSELLQSSYPTRPATHRPMLPDYFVDFGSTQIFFLLTYSLVQAQIGSALQLSSC